MGNTEGRRYEVTSRSTDLGGGWKLALLEDGQEAGGGVFPIATVNPKIAMDWWNALPVEERAYWLVKAASAAPVDAWRACLIALAYEDATQEGEDWVGNP